MLWIELKAKVTDFVQDRNLSDPSIRLNALKSLEKIIKTQFRDVYRNPCSLLHVDKHKFTDMLSQHKKLNSAEKSVVNHLYYILSCHGTLNTSEVLHCTKVQQPSTCRQKRGKPVIVCCDEDFDKPIYGLKPLINDNTLLLILGTFPAKESLEAKFYYQNQITRFWGEALSSVGSFESISNEERRRLLLEKHIGLWDIFQCAERGHSNQDGALEKAKYNNLGNFLNEHRSIQYLVFNGNNAFQWLKEDKPDVFAREGLQNKRLQSSSGSNGHFKHGEDWKQYFDSVQL